MKELWAYSANKIAVRFVYEWHDDSGQWFRSYGNENWGFNEQGFMMRRYASINDLPIAESTRKYRLCCKILNHWYVRVIPEISPKNQ